MTGINLQAILALIDQFYNVLIIIAGLIGIFNVGKSLLMFKIAVQMGGMNSMGTRSFYSEAALYMAVGLICAYLIAFITGVGEEIVGVQFEWDKPPAGTGAHLLSAVILKLIRLMGVYLCFRGVLKLTDRDGNGLSSFLRYQAFGLIAIFIIPFGEELGRLFGFNPVALFTPPTNSIISN